MIGDHRPAPGSGPSCRCGTAGRLAFGVAAALLLSGAVTWGQTTARGRLLSVEELQQSQAKLVGIALRVEGRLMLVGKDRIWMRNSSLLYRMAEGQVDVSQLPRRTANAELSGTLRQVEGKLVFEVQSIAPRPADLDEFQQRRQKLHNDPAGWLELGQWARQRGRFYGDVELRTRGAEAYRRALDLQRSKLERDDIPGRLALAEQAAQLELPDAFQQELRHEAYHIAWRLRDDTEAAGLARLLKQMERDLPGSTRPRPELNEALWQRYRQQPHAVYLEADGTTRAQVHRLLYADILLRTITLQLAEDGSNLFALAARIDEQLPEQHALAETYRDRALALRAAEVAKLPRREVLALADEYRARQQPEQAGSVIESWLTLRRRKLDPDDLEGVLQVSEDFRTLLGRHDTADRLLLDAAARHPQAQELADRLERAGYRRSNSTWLAGGVAPPEDAQARALREGRIEPGMTGTQVRQSLGEPTRIARSATFGQISEVWIYGSGASALSIQLTKRRLQTELTVIRVAPLAGAAPPVPAAPAPAEAAAAE